MQYAAQQRHHSSCKTPFWRAWLGRDQCFRLYLVSVLLVVISGACYTIYLYPEVFISTTDTAAALRPRHVVTIFPDTVKAKLPHFVNQYSIATDDNQQARVLLQQLTHKRSLLDPKSFHLLAWEATDFEHKLDSIELMDAACGSQGFGEAYHKHPHLRKDLMQWCLLLGRPDGFMDWTVEPEVAWTRSNKGIIGRYLQGDDDINNLESSVRVSSLLVMLPLDDAEFSGFRVSLSKSNLPTLVLDWILQTGVNLPEKEYQVNLEAFLFQEIEKNKSQWDYWTVAVTPKQRHLLDERSHRIASTCTTGDDNETCYSFYMP